MKLHQKFNKHGFSLRSRQGVYTIYKNGQIVLKDIPEKILLELNQQIK